MKTRRFSPKYDIPGTLPTTDLCALVVFMCMGVPLSPNQMAERTSSGEHSMQTANDCCKAGRVAAKYGFREYLDETISNDWAATDGPSLRKITTRFNKRIIQETLIDQGEPPLDGEEDLIYEHLIRESDRSSDRIERRLEDNGIDANSLREDFISYKTIDRHFKNCVDLERETKEPLSKSEAIDRIRAMNRRLEKVAENTLTEVSDHTSTTFETPDVSAAVTVTCPECGERKSFTAAVREGCGCERGSSSAESRTTDTEEPLDTTIQVDDT